MSHKNNLLYKSSMQLRVIHNRPERGAFLAAAVWDGQRGGHICIEGGIADDIPVVYNRASGVIWHQLCDSTISLCNLAILQPLETNFIGGEQGATLTRNRQTADREHSVRICRGRWRESWRTPCARRRQIRTYSVDARQSYHYASLDTVPGWARAAPDITAPATSSKPTKDQRQTELWIPDQANTLMTIGFFIFIRQMSPLKHFWRRKKKQSRLVGSFQVVLSATFLWTCCRPLEKLGWTVCTWSTLLLLMHSRMGYGEHEKKKIGFFVD